MSFAALIEMARENAQTGTGDSLKKKHSLMNIPKTYSRVGRSALQYMFPLCRAVLSGDDRVWMVGRVARITGVYTEISHTLVHARDECDGRKHTTT